MNAKKANHSYLEDILKPKYLRGTSGPKYNESYMFLGYLFDILVPEHHAIRHCYLPPYYHVLCPTGVYHDSRSHHPATLVIMGDQGGVSLWKDPLVPNQEMYV